MTKFCNTCETPKQLELFVKNKHKSDGHSGRCKEYTRLASKKYYLENPEKSKQATKNWINNHRDQRRAYDRGRADARWLSTRVRVNLNSSLRRIGAKKNQRSMEYVGCTVAELYLHLESQFEEGMTWENRSEWHIDHIIPLAAAQNQEEVEKLWHFTNLRPLWAKDNMKKGSTHNGVRHRKVAKR